MNESEKQVENDKRKRVFKENILAGEGISEIDDKRIKQDEKRAVKQEIDEKEKIEIIQQIKNSLNYNVDLKDILLFLVVQFLPILLIGSAFFVPGIIFLGDSYSSVVYVVLGASILILIGSLIYLYSIIRLLCAVTYKMSITQTEIKWRNVFWWNTIINQNITEVSAKYSFYFYLIRVGGILRFGVEIIQVVSDEKELWIRAYPLRKAKADQLVKTIMCWSELTQTTQKKEE
ncbi:MAG: hypothetical protein KAJ76_02680 [Candidatus Heimdallarchaeota archaeon]|nr:hypothetical protein [Candidatus Heimdallarchaeota archaeon]MCK5159651.1 hypothetical protein [Candidatus Heimdallarchaeota archaeon]MCK5297784.1 hypothetical protein [Candidatus Heimdallarchaeota archaeon]